MASDQPGSLPLSFPLRVETVRPRGSVVTVAAEAGQLAGIARMLDLASIEALEARYELSRNGERVKLDGRIEAALHQTCIVTLEPFPVKLAVPVRLDFAPQEEIRPRRGDSGDVDEEIDIEVLLNEADPPEPIVDGVIDLGAVTLEFLALALDPYPRKPGAQFEPPASDAGNESPFAALSRLKRPE